MRPHADQVKEWFDNVHALWDMPDGGNRRLIDCLERDLLEFLEQDKRGGDFVIDGYPTSTMSGGRGASPQMVDPDDPEAGSVVLTSVESAVEARKRAQRDEFRDHLEHAIDMLLQGVQSLGGFQNRMNAIRALRGDAPVRNERWCESHLAALNLQQPITDKVKKATDVAGRLSRPRLLCTPCYNFVAEHGRLPMADEFPAPGKSRWRVRTNGQGAA